MQTIVNLGTGGADLNGQNGSTTSADSNDALFLDWPGDNAGNYVYLPGVTNNRLTVPDEAALNITGDIDIRVRVAADDWTPGSDRNLLHKFSIPRSYALQVRSSGELIMYWSTDGTNVVGAISTATVSVADGEIAWVRATLDVDNGTSGNDVKFYTSSDGESWTQLGSTVTQAGTTSIYAGTTLLAIGAGASTGGEIPGKFYRAQVLDGIDGTPVLDVDCSQITSGADTSFTALTGQTVSINRSTSGRKTVGVVSPVWLFGTDDLIQVADNALLDFDANDSFTWIVVVRQWLTPPSGGQLLAKSAGGTASGYLITNGVGLPVRAFVRDGTNTAQTGNITPTAGQLQILSAVVDRSSQDLTFTGTGTSSTISTASVGSPSNTQPLRIAPSNDAEILAAAVYRRLLTVDEISAVTAYYQARLS